MFRRVLFYCTFMPLSFFAGIGITHTLRPVIQAQEPAQNTAKPTPTPAPEVKPKPIIITKLQQLEYENLQLKIRLAQTEMEAAIPQKLKDNFKTANENLTAFWAKLGITPDQDQEYDRSEGVDGAIILKPKPKEEKKVEGSAKKP